MKTKRLFFLAAMLLMSVCGFAQSGGGDPIPGDVNGDGVVDVGDIVAVINGAATGDVNNDGNVDGDDITAIIDIIQSNNENAPVTYKYYLGETEQETFTESDLVLTATEPITSITAHQSVGENEVTLWIYPTSWGRPSSIKSGSAEMLQSWRFNDDWAIVPYGYTSAWTAVDGTETWTVTWPYYKYYLGIISESNLQNQQYVNDLIANSPTTTTNAPITSITLPSGAPTNNGYEHIFIYPSDWGTPTLIDHNTSQVLPLNTLLDAGISNPTGYAGFFLIDPMNNAGGVIDITWSNN